MSASEKIDALLPSALPLPPSASPAARCRDASGKVYARHRWSAPGNVREDTGRRYCQRCSADEPGRPTPRPEPWSAPPAAPAPEPVRDPAPFGFARTGAAPEVTLTDGEVAYLIRQVRTGDAVARATGLGALALGGVLPRLERDTSTRIEEARAPMRLPTAEPRPSGPDGDAAMTVAADTGGCATGTADQGTTTGPTSDEVTSHAGAGGLMSLSAGTGQDRDAAPLPSTAPAPTESPRSWSGAASSAAEKAGAVPISPPTGGGALSPATSLSSPPPVGPQTPARGADAEEERNIRHRAAMLMLLDGIERAARAAREMIETR